MTRLCEGYRSVEGFFKYTDHPLILCFNDTIIHIDMYCACIRGILSYTMYKFVFNNL